MTTILWRDDPQQHDYPAAASYLSLLLGEHDVQAVVKALKKSSVTAFKAKDVLRSAQLQALPATNAHVASDLAKITSGAALSPVLLVQGDLRLGRALQIADGYHRVCAAYLTDENAEIHAKLTALG